MLNYFGLMIKNGKRGNQRELGESNYTLHLVFDLSGDFIECDENDKLYFFE